MNSFFPIVIGGLFLFWHSQSTTGGYENLVMGVLFILWGLFDVNEVDDNE